MVINKDSGAFSTYTVLMIEALVNPTTILTIAMPLFV